MTTSTHESGGLVSLSLWLQQIGITKTTAWRWRRKGWLKVTNISGKLYVSKAAADDFARRASAGEFSKTPVVPKPVTNN